MKVLFLSNLFPDAAEPGRGIYNARLVQQLGRLCEIRVISPRPTRGWPPFWRPVPATGRAEDLGFSPVFPPAAYLPKIGGRWNHRLMARCLRHTVRTLREAFPFDVALASWAFPDGCAVARLAAEFSFPFAVIAQGSDVHQYLRMPPRRRIITAALNRAGAAITRSRELARLLREAGVREDQLHTVYNGVDAGVFRPGDAAAARAGLGFAAAETVLLYAGNFQPVKNPALAVASLAALARLRPGRRLRLVMIGDGPLRERVRRQAEAAGLGGQVMLPGRQSPGEVARHMQAADLLCIPSRNEGVPNVLLEAFACGLRAAATRVGGIPEILTGDHLGRLVEPDSADAMARAMDALLLEPPRTGMIVAEVRGYSWAQTASAIHEILEATAREWPARTATASVNGPSAGPMDA